LVDEHGGGNVVLFCPMAYIDDFAKLGLVLLCAVVSLLALWAAVDRRSSAALFIRSVWSGPGRHVVVAVLALGVFGVVVEDVVFREHDEVIGRLDARIRDAVMPLAPSLHRKAALVSRVTGEGLALVVPVVAAGLLLARRRREALTVVLGTLAAWGLSGLLKVGFGVYRPRVDGRSSFWTSFGFPSGHTFVMLVAGGLMVWALRHLMRRHVRLGLAAVVWIVAAGAGMARVILNAHWPSDVLGALALGAACLSLLWAFTEWRWDPPTGTST
jgi:membrane-associated phospholipid phosphatase